MKSAPGSGRASSSAFSAGEGGQGTLRSFHPRMKWCQSQHSSLPAPSPSFQGDPWSNPGSLKGSIEYIFHQLKKDISQSVSVCILNINSQQFWHSVLSSHSFTRVVILRVETYCILVILLNISLFPGKSSENG